MEEITIIKPDDLHIHLRDGVDLINYAIESSKQFKRGIVMPNIVPPITTVTDVEKYRSAIKTAAPDFEPLMTFKMLPSTDPDYIKDLMACGVIAGKFYPAGATTNSEDGIRDWKVMIPVLTVMEELGMVLSIHGELPGSFIMDRERDFLPILIEMNEMFPKLKIVLEHVSSKDGIECIKSLPKNVVGTITLHHLLSTIEDAINDSNNKCMPIPKFPEDRDAIITAVLSGDSNFFFGSDSAPHKIESKNCFKAKAGVFTAPVLLPKLAEFFENNGALDKFEGFVSKIGADFYGLPYNNSKIKIIKKTMIVPEEIAGVRPYLAGETISWSLDL